MANVFLVPCDPGNYDRTVGSSVDLSEYPERPDPLQNMTEARFWGARDGDGNQSYLEKMEPGDLVLFYQDAQYIGAGFIGTTFEDEAGWIRTTFWKNAPSTLIYTINDFKLISVPRSKVNRIFDYTTDYYPQGLTRVADNRVSNRLGAIKLALEKTSG